MNWDRKYWQLFLWIAILIIVLLSLGTPFIIFTFPFVMVPLLILYLKLDLRRFMLAYVSSLFILFLLAREEGIRIGLLSMWFLPTVLVMGHFYKKKAAARVVLAAGAMTTLVGLLLSLLLSFMAGLEPIIHLKAEINNRITMMPEEFRRLVPSNYADLVIQQLPLFMLLFSIFFALWNHWIVRKLMRNSNAPLPGLPPMRQWMLPKSMMWYLIIVTVLNLFLSAKSDPYLLMVVLNLLPMLVFAFAIQAVGFLSFITHMKGWGRALPIIAIVLLFLNPRLMYFYSFFGFIDVMFPIRNRWQGKF